MVSWVFGGLVCEMPRGSLAVVVNRYCYYYCPLLLSIYFLLLLLPTMMPYIAKRKYLAGGGDITTSPKI